MISTKTKSIASLAAIAVCGLVIHFTVRARPVTDEDPEIAALRHGVLNATDPASVAEKMSARDASKVAFSLDRVDYTDAMIPPLRTWITMSSKSEWLPTSRDALMVTGKITADSRLTVDQRDRMMELLVLGGTDTNVRMKSTFVSTCQDNKALLAEPRLRTIFARIAESGEKTLNLSDRARAALAD